MSQLTISEEQLEKLSREELIAVVKLLLSEIEQLKARVTELEAKSPSGKPPATSRNSSQPPSRDQKTNTGEKKSKKRLRAKPSRSAITKREKTRSLFLIARRFPIRFRTANCCRKARFRKCQVASFF